MKELRYPNIEKLSNNYSEVKYDFGESLLAKEHMGYYLIIKYPSQKQSFHGIKRLYLSYKYKNIFYNAIKERDGAIPGYCGKENSPLYIYDHHPTYKNFIDSILDSVIVEVIPFGRVERIIKGLNTFLCAMRDNHILLNCIGDVKNNYQKIAYSYVKAQNTNKSKMNQLRTFFGKVFLAEDNFILDTKVTRVPQNHIEGLSTDIVYQLDYYAQKEIRELIKNVNLYNQWMVEYNKIKLFSLSNLAHTVYSRIDKLGSRAVSFNKVLTKIAQKIYNINLISWKKKRDNKFEYNNQTEEHLHKKLIKIAKKGIDIDIVNEKMFAFWHKELFPDFPLSKKVNKKYEFIMGAKNQIDKFRSLMGKKIAIDIAQFNSKIFPNNENIYPIILVIMIREGTNSEVLRNWMVTKKDGKFSLGNKMSHGTIIESVKHRTNSLVTTCITNDSIQKKYLDFYLEWLSPYYEKSNYSNFFQYVNVLYNKESSAMSVCPSSRFFKYINSFYIKYNIVNKYNERIFSIDHRTLRVSSNYVDYLRGYNEFERQMKKSHRNINTQISYENHTEYKTQKMNKIVKTQELIVRIINDKEPQNSKIANLFNGPLADCTNPSSPTYFNAPQLKENEKCTNWFKCLSQCSHSNVIPRVHGPVIYAWIEFMNEKRYEWDLISWEKEYLVDYNCAKEVLKAFTKKDNEYSKKNFSRYSSLVRMNFQKITKVKGSENAG